MERESRREESDLRGKSIKGESGVAGKRKYWREEEAFFAPFVVQRPLCSLSNSSLPENHYSNDERRGFQYVVSGGLNGRA